MVLRSAPISSLEHSSIEDWVVPHFGGTEEKQRLRVDYQALHVFYEVRLGSVPKLAAH